MGKEKFFQQVSEQLDKHMQKNDFGLLPLSIPKRLNKNY
jgi:hypothetical protein